MMDLGTLTSIKTKPFLKWVGGKGRLLPQLAEHFPDPFEFNNYFEPFVGGGAVFFKIQPAHKSYINDINNDLMDVYIHMRDYIDLLIDRLKRLENEYLLHDEEGRKYFFLEKRKEYNSEPDGTLSKACLFLFLNRTCFNGLYRENRKGEFNVPFGRYANPVICNEPVLRAASRDLQNTVITTGPYERAVENAKKGDFVYFDPPYHPLNETSSFTSYHEGDFTKEDQEKLCRLFKQLDTKGCLVALSNSDSEFIRTLYIGYDQHQILAGRSINSQASKRGKITELLITNY